ncbi:nudix hydrolase 9-like [Nicotiana sylvestris]|uniref:nudix hydrolase 9-like n=1 Tax=Nicotiana sylvestris TaxID=4096 RepID=UPI00388C5EB8
MSFWALVVFLSRGSPGNSLRSGGKVCVHITLPRPHLWDYTASFLLLSCPSGLSPSQVSVVFNEAYDRIPHPDPFLEQSIFEEWEARERLSSIYNRPKFRYGGYTFDVGNDPKQQPHVSL